MIRLSGSNEYPIEVSWICHDCGNNISKIKIENEEQLFNLKKINYLSCRCGGHASLYYDLTKLILENFIFSPEFREINK